jgi:hypothetical protein
MKTFNSWEEMGISAMNLEIRNIVEIYEKVLSSHEKRYRAGYTKRMICQLGAVKAVEKLIRNRKPQVGFTVLANSGKKDQTFEALVVRHPDKFEPDVVELAKKRLG